MTTDWSYDPQPPRPGWGVRVPSRKAEALLRPVRVLPPPAEAILPIVQGSGDEASPLVATGDPVLTGQPIARMAAGTTICASITGRVIAIERRAVPGPTACRATCLVIRREGPERHDARFAPVDALGLEPADICARVAAAGIVGLGGAMYPTATKLAPGTPIRALIVNGAECEPWITCDEMLIRERAASVVAGTRIMMRALGTDHAVIAVESDMPEARVALDSALGASDAEGIGLAVVTAKYPAGGERQLIELVAGREVPSGGLPRDIGFVCHNVGTAAAVADLFGNGRPLVSRLVTVTGGGVREPGNFEARIGTPIADLVAEAGGYQGAPARLIMGGPMMGWALPDDELPVTRATNCIVAALPGELATARPEMPCIRCGACIEACPAHLLPQELFHAARRGTSAGLTELGLEDCIECGCCDYVCPSNIALTARFAAAKRAAREEAFRTGSEQA